MRLIVKRCAEPGCLALGLGPRAVRLYPFEDRLFCAEHFKSRLDWHEKRESTIDGIQHMTKTWAKADAPAWARPTPQWPARDTRPVDWRAYLRETCDLMELAFQHGDKRSFTYYGSRALYAWELLAHWRKP